MDYGNVYLFGISVFGSLGYADYFKYKIEVQVKTVTWLFNLFEEL